MIVYDIETKKGIQNNIELRKPGYEYAEGWEDYTGMGIAVLALYDYKTGKYSDFSDSPNDIKKVNEIFDRARIISGFNIKEFDNPLARAHGIIADDKKSYDILEQLIFASGITGEYAYRGFSLNKVLEANFENVQKMMNGADAPFLWQDGKVGIVRDYCLDDVDKQKMTLNRMFETGGLISPKTKQFVKMSMP